MQLLEKIIEYAGDRIKTFGDVIHYAEPLLVSDYELKLDPLTIEDKERLCAWRDVICCALSKSEWSAENLQKETEKYCEYEGIKLKDIVHIIRYATTGKKTGFSLFHTLELLGKESTNHRVDLANCGFCLDAATKSLIMEIKNGK